MRLLTALLAFVLLTTPALAYTPTIGARAASKLLVEVETP